MYDLNKLFSVSNKFIFIRLRKKIKVSTISKYIKNKIIVALKIRKVGHRTLLEQECC